MLTTAAFLEKAAALRAYIEGNNLFDYQVYQLAQRLGLKRFLIFAFNRNLQTFYETSRSSNFDRHASLEEIITLIKTNQGDDHYFILNTGGHWVVVALVKLGNQPPQLIYLDSMNARLDERYVGTTFLRFLCQHMFD